MAGFCVYVAQNIFLYCGKMTQTTSGMKKFFLRFFQLLGLLILLLLITAGVLYYQAVNYDTPLLHIQEASLRQKLQESGADAVAQELVGKMSLEEKIAQMYGESYSGGLIKFLANILIRKRFPHVYVGQNERLGIPPWVLSDGPRGARVLSKEIDNVTTFPVAMSRGASWDVDLEQRVHEVIASEMRANGTNYAATPCINLLRHPGWGRAQETYGEDPWHLGEFGLAAVKGIEKHKVMACPKHYALNSIENSRWVVDVKVDERSLREVYLPHFKKTIQEGQPASLMSAYNSVNGDFCGSNKALLTDILRDDWGFKGFVSTDWLFGLYDGPKGVQAGLDVEMPFGKYYTVETLRQAIETGDISEADIDAIVQRILATRLPYALGDDQDQYPQSIIGKESSVQLAREAAEQGMVLLKNENVLPLSKTSNKKVAVIGRLADVENTGDQGSSNSTAPYVRTPYQGIKAHQEALGNQVTLDDGSQLERAKTLAEQADEVVVVVGFTFEDEGEYILMSREVMEQSAEAGQAVGEKGVGGDRDNLRLRAEDEALIQALAETNEKLVVVYVGGSAIDMSAWDEKVPAILYVWYGGMEGGTALARILYGDVSPSGKLPFSIAQNATDYPHFTPFAKSITYDYYHGYTLFDKKNTEVAYPFGFGLSYANFAYDSLQVSNPEMGKQDVLQLSVQVRNEGNMAAKEIVQLYVGFSNSTVDRPVKLLRDFAKVTLAPGETKEVSLQVAAEDLARYDTKLQKWVVDAMEYEIYVGASSREKDLMQSTFRVQ